MRHTAGPWKPEPNYRSSGWYVDQPAHNRRLAQVNERDAGIEREECEANAHLIAAAPDLLAACQSIIREIEASDSAADPCVRMWSDVVRAAIAKATGNA